MNFVKTSDVETAELLRKVLQELPKEGKFFVFLNNGRQNFADNKNIVYTDKLSI